MLRVTQKLSKTSINLKILGSRSYYDFWEEWASKNGDSKPEFSLLGSGTDHAGFAFYAGVPAINLVFKIDNKKYKDVGTYPPYHTGYDTFYLVDKILDPGVLSFRLKNIYINQICLTQL